MIRATILLILCTFATFAQTVVFRGLPFARVLSTAERDHREKLEPGAADKAACVIVQRKNKYYWQSRNDAPLNRIDLDNYTYFLHASGLGFIKVFTGTRNPDPAAPEYIESYTQGMEAITYWGRVQNPE